MSKPVQFGSQMMKSTGKKIIVFLDLSFFH